MNNVQYRNYTITALREECKKRHINNYSKLKKDELINILECDDRNIKVIYKTRSKKEPNSKYITEKCECRMPNTKIFEFMCKNCQIRVCSSCLGSGHCTVWPVGAPIQKLKCDKCGGMGKMF